MSDIYRANRTDEGIEVYRHIRDAADQRYLVSKETNKDEEGKTSEKVVVTNKGTGEKISGRSTIYKRVITAVEEMEARNG